MTQHIRNFCIIAHIDHGKSTLADRMLEMTGTMKKSEKGQVLDTMDLEQERGITIKMTPARMQRKGYELNLIDTPGHADFQYEVSRSLAAVEGVVLLVDASQGIQAQTLSTLYMAMDHDLEIIPVMNKIDLPAADPERVGEEIENIIWVPKEDIIKISAKTGENVELVLDTIIEKIPAPTVSDSPFAKALIFDSVYDQYKGVVVYVKMISWSFQKGTKLRLIHTETEMTPPEVGFLNPKYNTDKTIKEGQIGYVVTGKKSVRDAKIGDTIIAAPSSVDQQELNTYAISGFQPAKPYVYAGVYPIETSDYDKLKESFEKLLLNDSAIEFTNESSKALGFGFRCGFLGMLHMDIIKERLDREYNMQTILTTPTVMYLVKSKTKSLDMIKEGKNTIDLIETGLYKEALPFVLEDYKSKIEEIENLYSFNEKVDAITPYLEDWIVVKSWADMVEKGNIDTIYEPYAEVEIVGPNDYAGNIMSLVQEYRGQMQHMEHLDQTRVVRKYLMPLGEIIIDFYDRLKSATKGYATMNYEFKKYQESDLSKLDIFINGELVEAFSLVVHRDKAYYVGKDIVERLKELIPKHMFPIPLQAGIGSKMIARETISAMRKDVIAKCYGGDISRKKKLLKKQKEGKKKMKAMGNVSVPSDVFVKMVTRGE